MTHLRDPEVDCPYCGDRRFASDGAASAVANVVLLRCLTCGAFSHVFKDDHPSKPVLSSCGVYFAECGGFIKIGLSNELGLRLQQLLAQNPLPLRMIGIVPTAYGHERALERVLHARFRDDHHRFEWFRSSPGLLEWIGAHALTPDKFLEAKPKKWDSES